MIKYLKSITPILLAFATVSPFFAADKAHAIPAFSRTYKIECTTCHTIYPELNEYGEAFLKNSYVYFGTAKKGEKKVTTAVAPVKAPNNNVADNQKISGSGDATKLAKLKAGVMASGDAAAPDATSPTAIAINTSSTEAAPEKAEGLVLAGIPEILPISFTGTINYEYNRNRVNELDFATRSLKLHAGGNFREKIGFFGTFVAYSENPNVSNSSESLTNNPSNINELLISWRHIFDTPVNIRIGRMQPKLGLWKINNKLSGTNNNYLPYTYTVGKSSFSEEQSQDTIELNSVLEKRFYIAGGIINRKGQNTKEGFGHISYKFGGADFLANEPDIDLQKEENFLDYLTLTVGSYGYYGKNGIVNSNEAKNNYYRVGFDAELLYKISRLRLLSGYGVDDNASLDVDKTLVRSKALTVEYEATLLINLIAAARFEYLQQEPKYVTNNFQNQYIRRYIVTAGYAPLENVKLTTEFKYQIANHSIDRIGILGASFSF